jgi:hypothetical protein
MTEAGIIYAHGLTLDRVQWRGYVDRVEIPDSVDCAGDLDVYFRALSWACTTAVDDGMGVHLTGLSELHNEAGSALAYRYDTYWLTWLDRLRWHDVADYLNIPPRPCRDCDQQTTLIHVGGVSPSIRLRPVCGTCSDHSQASSVVIAEWMSGGWVWRQPPS